MMTDIKYVDICAMLWCWAYFGVGMLVSYFYTATTNKTQENTCLWVRRSWRWRSAVLQVKWKTLKHLNL